MITSIGLNGMKGFKVFAEADVRIEKEQCVIIGLPDASTTDAASREAVDWKKKASIYNHQESRGGLNV